MAVKTKDEDIVFFCWIKTILFVEHVTHYFCVKCGDVSVKTEAGNILFLFLMDSRSTLCGTNM